MFNKTTMEVWVKMLVDCPIEDGLFWEYKKLYLPHSYVHNINDTLSKLFEENYLTVLQYEIVKVQCHSEP